MSDPGQDTTASAVAAPAATSLFVVERRLPKITEQQLAVLLGALSGAATGSGLAATASGTCAQSSWPAKNVCCHCSPPTALARSRRSARPRSSHSPASSPPSSCPSRTSRSCLRAALASAYADP